MFRRHLRAIISFPAGILAMSILMSILAVLAGSQIIGALLIALGMPIMVGCVLLVITVVFCAGRGPEFKAEWSALAPALAVSTVVANHWNNIVTQIVTQLVNIPFLPGSTVRWVAAIILNIAFLTGICLLGAAVASRWMDRVPTSGRSKGLNQQVAAVAILIIVVQGCFALAHEIAWRAFATPLPDLDAISAQTAVCRGGVLLGLLAAWLVIALVAWRGADRLSRWRLISLFSVWVCMDSWTRDLHWVLPQINPYPYEWTWALAIGVEAGIIAILYAHLVVGSLWRRAFEPTGQASSPLESGLPH